MSDTTRTVRAVLEADTSDHVAGFKAAGAANDEFLRSESRVSAQVRSVAEAMTDARNPAEAFATAIEGVGRSVNTGLAVGVTIAAVAAFADGMSHAYEEAEKLKMEMEAIGRSDIGHGFAGIGGISSEIDQTRAVIKQLNDFAHQPDNLGQRLQGGFSLVANEAAGLATYIGQNLGMDLKNPKTGMYAEQVDAAVEARKKLQELDSEFAKESVGPQIDLLQQQVIENGQLVEYKKLILDYEQQILDAQNKGLNVTAQELSQKEQWAKALFAIEQNEKFGALTAQADIAMRRSLINHPIGLGGNLQNYTAGLWDAQQQAIMTQAGNSRDPFTQLEAEKQMIGLRDALRPSLESLVSYKEDSLAAIGGGGNVGKAAEIGQQQLEVLDKIDQNIAILAGRASMYAGDNNNVMK